jgi:hypothetical protein
LTRLADFALPLRIRVAVLRVWSKGLGDPEP